MRYLCYKIIFAFVLLGFWSCRSEDVENDMSLRKGEQVIFGANVNNIISSRALPQKGMIIDGNLHVLYFPKQGNYQTAEVDFIDGIGYTYIGTNASRTPLLWDDVAVANVTNQTYNFFYDNLAYDVYENLGNYELPADHPYRFRKYKSNGDGLPEGDLLWGSVIGVKKSNGILLTLNHIMSLLTLQISIDDKGFGERKPKKAWISYCRSAIEKINRMSGWVKEYSYLPNDEIPDLPDLQLADEDEEIYTSGDWGKTFDEETGVRYYNSPAYLVPPQEFNTGYLPRLTIELDDGSTYSGVFPQYVFLEEANGQISQRRIQFMSGYKLNLAVRISSEANSLNFIYAQVNYWNDMGTYNVTGKQASLADEKDFNKLIEAYNSASSDADKNKDDKYGFYQWGFYDENTQKWIFNIFQNQSITESAISRKMPKDSALPYEFSLHYATLTLLMDDGTELAISADNGGAEKLKDMLTKGEIENGIYSASDLKLLADNYKATPSKNLEPWGGARKGQQWNFSIYQDFEITASDFTGLMEEHERYKYEFVFGDKKVTVILPDKKKVVLSADNGGEAKLKALLSDGVMPE